MNKRTQMLIDWRTENTVEDLDPIEIEVKEEPERKAFSEDHVDEEEVEK